MIVTGNETGRRGYALALGAANGLRFAATPTYAVMAVLNGFPDSANMMCSAMHDPWSLGGMPVMYALMSTFHLVPWLKLVLRQCQAAY
jgi:hypothetical protein